MKSFIEKRDELVTRISNMIEDFDIDIELRGGRVYAAGAAYRYDLVETLKEAEEAEDSQKIADLHNRLNNM